MPLATEAIPRNEVTFPPFSRAFSLVLRAGLLSAKLSLSLLWAGCNQRGTACSRSRSRSLSLSLQRCRRRLILLSCLFARSSFSLSQPRIPDLRAGLLSARQNSLSLSLSRSRRAAISEAQLALSLTLSLCLSLCSATVCEVELLLARAPTGRTETAADEVKLLSAKFDFSAQTLGALALN